MHKYENIYVQYMYMYVNVHEHVHVDVHHTCTNIHVHCMTDVYDGEPVYEILLIHVSNVYPVSLDVIRRTSV